MRTSPETVTPQIPYKVLIVDDEEDVHQITRISLRSLSHRGNRVNLVSARSGAEARQCMRDNPDIAVVLLDVVMESDHAGLDLSRFIREQLGNAFARIILRTGQPGRAPEETVVQAYEIDGYLPKAELTSTHLITTVRTALKAYDELVDLESRRRNLETVHESVRELNTDSTWAEFRLEDAGTFESETQR
ncbi:response regulator [Streptomyces wedmorensis]